ncbi:MAG: hypothetical protein OXF41_08605 [bacterium]|nr:hypothetical protein [bacterium]
MDDLSHLKRVPASTLRGLGLAEVHPHRLAMLSDRPLWRHVPTPAGIAALGGDDLLYSHPVSRQWLRLLAERLNGVALIYEMAALIAGADPKQDPVRVEYCCSGPYDALVTLSGGRTLGIVAGRPGGTRGGAPRVRGAAEATPGMAFRRRRAGDAAQRRRCVRGRARAHGRGSERPRAP